MVSGEYSRRTGPSVCAVDLILSCRLKKLRWKVHVACVEELEIYTKL